MEKLIGFNKSIDEQIDVLEKILMKNKVLKEIFNRLQDTSLKNYYVGAGCINQTVFNYYHDNDLNFGINDYDIVYFDDDTSYEKEDMIIKEVSEKLNDLNVCFDIKNEARVHIWYNEKYHTNRKPYTSLEDAIRRWGTTITCIGVRYENGKLKVFAPYGLNDLYSLTIRPVKIDFTKEQYEEKSKKWKEKWSKLQIIPWD